MADAPCASGGVVIESQRREGAALEREAAEQEDASDGVATERELEALLRALPDIYFRLDAQGYIVAWHAGRESELHVPPERFIGQRPHDVIEKPFTEDALLNRVRDILDNRSRILASNTNPNP